MGMLEALLQQCRRPTGRLGRWVARGMNLGHAGLTRWALAQIDVPEAARALDIGCGGGATLARLARMARSGKVVGIDYSEESVAVSRRRNRREGLAGRVEVHLGSVSSLPFPEATFDLVTAIETYYFWPDLSKDLSEVRRVMKPGAQLVMVAAAYNTPRFDRRNRRFVDAIGMTYLSPSEAEEALVKAGFDRTRVAEDHRRGWLCVTGRKPDVA
jgi:ubiquinone/menaquinone biosynthesis C-methylase UbiE